MRFLDLRYAFRLMRRQPGFAATAIVSLALGIGTTTGVFSIANGLLFRPLPGVSDPDELIEIVRTREGRQTLGDPTSPYTDYVDLRQRTTLLADIYAQSLQPEVVSLEDTLGTRPAFAGIVSSNYFTTLGVRAASGRLFEGDGTSDREIPLAVLSFGFWSERYQADVSIIGRDVRLNGHAFTVIGIAAPDFHGTNLLAPHLWIPVEMMPVIRPGPYSLTDRRSTLWILLGGRLKPGTSIQSAASEIAGLGDALEREYPNLRGGMGYTVVGAATIPGSVRVLAAGFLSFLMGLVSIVLLVACVNVAGVQLARDVVRRREIAVRIAMGAGRARLVAQLLTESLLLFVAGGALGLLVARGMTTGLMKLLPAFPVPIDVSLPIDVRVALFALLVSAAAAVLTGLVPIRHALKTDVVAVMKDDIVGIGERLRARNFFVLAQVSLSVVLAIAGGLFIRALERTSDAQQGFDPRGVEVASIDLASAGYSDADGARFTTILLGRLRELPAVEEAAVASSSPAQLRGRLIRLTVPGATAPDGTSSFAALAVIVSPGYFTTLRIPVVAGRDFSPRDGVQAPPAIVLSESAARAFWPRQNAIGESLILRASDGGARADMALDVIGVARDLTPGGSTRPPMRIERRAQSGSVTEALAPPIVYLPIQQSYASDLTVFARAAAGQRAAADLRAAVLSLDPTIPLLTLASLDTQTGPVFTQLRILAAVTTGVGGIGLALSAFGIYGLLSYLVARRTREIGIRVALGASRGDVIRMILLQGMRLVFSGLVVGIGLSMVAGQLARGMLFGLPPLDPVAFGGATALFAAVGLWACYGPAARASRIDAGEALRHE